MEFRKGGLLVHSEVPAAPPKTHSTPSKLRKKLQKSVTRQKSNLSWRLGTLSSTDASKNNKSDTANNSKPSLDPLPSPDLSDSKWAGFFKGSRCIYTEDSQSDSGSQEQDRSPAQIVPELSHLVTSDGQPRKSSSSDTAAVAPRIAMRRRAKTPIFSIGQLEAIPRPRNALGKTSSVELIAEQYRALLESGDSDLSIYSDSYSEPPPSRQGVEQHQQQQRPLSIRRQQSSGDLRRASVELERRPEFPIPLVTGSPSNSDDETLVSFEEETVYFKPVSYSPEPSPRLLHPLPPTPAAPDSLSLQICLDLLTRDLASALASRPGRSTPETSALQVWVMIEAYEKLRDELVGKRLGCEETGSLEAMLNMWLRALYTIHDKLTHGRWNQSESDYGAELGIEELD
ncbi:hypothetical protein QBC43DRAFT_206452 [Cladorrhinum sp. PSN259]|nr:hypothetical protein QBC43DRAFT_206452 [Cladorrhinum sp. PSN259]